MKRREWLTIAGAAAVGLAIPTSVLRASASTVDAPDLIANDPFRGVQVRDGKLVLPHEPGLGVVPV